MFRYIAISLQAQTTHTGLRLETSVLTAQIQISQDEMPLMEQVLHRWAVGGGAFDFAFGTFGVGGTLRTMDLVSSLNHDLHHQKQWTVHKRHKYNSFALTSCNGQLDGFQGPIVAGQGSITRTDSTIHLGEQLWSVLQIIQALGIQALQVDLAGVQVLFAGCQLLGKSTLQSVGPEW